MSDLAYCEKCDEEIADTAKAEAITDPWGGVHGFWCRPCADNYDGPSDNDLSDFYGSSSPQTDAERYRVAAEEKERLG